MFAPYCYKQLVVKCNYVYYNKCKHSLAVVHLTIIFFFNYQPLLVIFTAAFFPIIIHSLLITHFTSIYYYTLKIAWLSCIFACIYSLPHPNSLTIITHVGGPNGVNTEPMKHWLPFLNNINPI